MEAQQPGISVAAVARRHGIVTSMVFRWRVQFGLSKDMAVTFATVNGARKGKRRRGEREASAFVLNDLLPIPDGMAAVDLSDGRHVFAPIGSDPEAVRRNVVERDKTEC